MPVRFGWSDGRLERCRAYWASGGRQWEKVKVLGKIGRAPHAGNPARSKKGVGGLQRIPMILAFWWCGSRLGARLGSQPLSQHLQGEQPNSLTAT